jgi:hypothetical protein
MFPSVTATAVVEAVDRVIGWISCGSLAKAFRGDPGSRAIRAPRPADVLAESHRERVASERGRGSAKNLHRRVADVTDSGGLRSDIVDDGRTMPWFESGDSASGRHELLDCTGAGA